VFSLSGGNNKIYRLKIKQQQATFLTACNLLMVY